MSARRTFSRGAGSRAAIVTGVLAATLLVGCSSPAPPPTAPPPTAPPPTAPPPAAPPPTAAAPALSAADVAACKRHAERVVLLRREAASYSSMPVPPVRVALVLANTLEFYQAPGAQDPVLTAALAEVAAAIKDLDAQGKAKVPPGGSLLDPVQLDVSRVQAAAAAVDRACAGV